MLSIGAIIGGLESPLAIITQYFTQYGSFQSLPHQIHWCSRPILSSANMQPKSLVWAMCCLWGMTCDILSVV